MSSFIDPKFLYNLAKNYLSDINRPWSYDKEKLRKYQDKQLRKIVKYAYTVPMYRDKYKKAGVHPEDIHGINDIGKLPFITKDDLRNNYPENIKPYNFKTKDGFTISTSGSTGKPVFIYIDRFAAIKSLLAFIRVLKAYGGDWRTTKSCLIIDVEPGSAENAFFSESLMPFAKKFISMDHVKYLHLGEKPEKIIKELNFFQPEFLASDPNMLRQLAYLKHNGQGKNVQPKFIGSGGSTLDEYTKKYVEKAFNTRVFDIYGTTEGGPIGFECVDGNFFHIHSDYVYMEIIDDNNKNIPFNKPGHTVITKLYGKGTPIIRYTGIDDLVVPIDKKTSCGITSKLIKHIEGRTSELIYLPNGKTLSPLSVTGIPAKAMEFFNSYKIKQFQIVQHDLDDVEILVVIDEKQRNKGVMVEELIDELQKRFQQKIGKSVKVRVTETDHIQKDARSDQIKVIVSKIKK
jgi:phenylacetate-CoA ligase